jgi:hypothetical protein
MLTRPRGWRRDHRRRRDRRAWSVAEIADVVFGDLAQDAAHDFAAAGFWQAGRPLDDVGRRCWADFVAHHLHEFALEIVAWFDALPSA